MRARRVSLRSALRVVALTALSAAVLGPVGWMGGPIGASASPVSDVSVAAPRHAQLSDYVSDYAVAPGPFADYYRARGGARTFGPPISNRFTLLGQNIQIFRNHALRENLDGSISTIGLLETSAIPALSIGGQRLPSVDQALLAASPIPGTPNYAARSQEFIRANVPDEWQGVPVGFHRAFLATVTFQESFPAGSGDAGLLPGFAQEVWGLPISRPTPDPSNPSLIYLRWERGVMEYDARTGRVSAGALGDAFKAVLTGEGLPPDLAVAAQGSPLYRQVDPAAPGGVARPAELPDSSLLAAFQPAGSAVPPAAVAAAPVVSAPAAAAPALTAPTPTPTPALPTPAAPIPPPAAPAPIATTATLPTDATFATPATTPFTTAGVPSSTPAVTTIATPGGTPGAATGSDPCYGDENVTYSPSEPRVGNEVLIAVTSSRPHAYGRLAGSERPTFVRERPGQLGVVYEYTLSPTQPGRQEYTYYVDSTIPCKSISFRVRPAFGVTPINTNSNRNSNSNGNSNTNVNLNYNVNGNANDNTNSSESADLSVTVTDSPDPVTVSSNVTYTVSVTNGGPATAQRVQLTDSISGTASIQSSSTTRGSCSQSGTTVTCNLNDLESGSVATVTIVVRPTAAGTLVNTSTVFSSRSDANQTNNSASQSTTVR